MKRRSTAPGEMLLDEVLKPAGITQVALGREDGHVHQRVNGIIASRSTFAVKGVIALMRGESAPSVTWASSIP
jgi:plasmid maintenance system antidote protein VapI